MKAWTKVKVCASVKIKFRDLIPMKICREKIFKWKFIFESTRAKGQETGSRKQAGGLGLSKEKSRLQVKSFLEK